MFKSHTCTVDFFWRLGRTMCSQNNWWIFWSSNRFSSSRVQSLSLSLVWGRRIRFGELMSVLKTRHWIFHFLVFRTKLVIRMNFPHFVWGSPEGTCRELHECFHRQFLSNFGPMYLSEKVNEFFLSLCFSCSGHAWISKWTLAFRDPTYAVCSFGVVFGMISFFFCLELPLEACSRLDFSPWKTILDFLLEMSCRQKSLSERRHATNVSTLLAFQLASSTDSPMLSVGL